MAAKQMVFVRVALDNAASVASGGSGGEDG
jgi:hypothetical protein